MMKSICQRPSPAAVDVERPQMPDVPVLHPFPHADADVDALRKALVEAEELTLPIAQLIDRRCVDGGLRTNPIEDFLNRSKRSRAVRRRCSSCAAAASPPAMCDRRSTRNQLSSRQHVDLLTKKGRD